MQSPNAQPSASAGLKSAPSRWTALLIEGTPDSRAAIQGLLAQLRPTPGVDLVRESTLAGGLAQLSRRQFDIILLDLALPADGALEGLTWLSKTYPQVPVVVLANHPDRPVEALTLQSGAQDYLVKRELTPASLERALRFAIERHKIEETRRELAVAETAVRERDEFMAIAAHELRTPVTALSGYVQLLRRRVAQGRDLDRASLDHYLQVIDDSARRLHRLGEQLLDFTQLQTGQLQLKHELIDVAAIVQRLATVLQVMAPRQPLRVRCVECALIMADAVRTEQVITNLIRNAQKFGGGEAPIDISVSLPRTEVVEITVRDRGPGIPSEIRERIFERHFRGHSASQHHDGLGLGLYVSRNIVEGHGGSMHVVEPPDGIGSQFVVQLPRVHPELDGKRGSGRFHPVQETDRS